MNFSKYFMSLRESDDESIYNQDDVFGVDKMNAPSEEGFATARKAANYFTNASDGQNTDVNMIMNVAIPKPKNESGFGDDIEIEESFFMEEDNIVCDGEECVDTNTIPAVPSEDDQFSDPNEEDAMIGTVSDEELASGDDDIIGESATGWDDLF